MMDYEEKDRLNKRNKESYDNAQKIISEIQDDMVKTAQSIGWSAENNGHSVSMSIPMRNVNEGYCPKSNDDRHSYEWWDGEGPCDFCGFDGKLINEGGQ